MHLHFLDIAVLVTYFGVILTAGTWFTRISSRSLRSYFLAENNQKWWMLAASGSASNYSVDGTVWNISMLMVLGMLSWYTTLVWWMPCEIVLMAFMAIWIRRTGAMTAADLNTVRFGADMGARAARVGFAGHSLALVNSAMGYPAYYPVRPVKVTKPLKAVLMDLDGTSVRSEFFWIWIIQLTTASLLGHPKFELEESDLPHVSGHSVSEHLQYCIGKYCPAQKVEDARRFYFEHTHREMRAIMEGRGRADAFKPAPGLKEFLLELKGRGLRIGLVTSGLYEKAMPEIVSAFRQLKLGDPVEFYDAIITAGFPMRQGREAGTLGDLSPKPHPWLYAEACRVGLGIPFEERDGVIGMEDSGAGICSIRLAGFAGIGIGGGNIGQSGMRALCWAYHEHLADALPSII